MGKFKNKHHKNAKHYKEVISATDATTTEVARTTISATTATTTRRTALKPCHVGPIEVYPNLFCGSRLESLHMIDAEHGVQTLVPLNDCSGTIWERGFRGELLYYPIEDYGVLPTDVLQLCVDQIIDRVTHDRKVGIFCQGGHGRTGYIAMAVLGKLGIEDPVAYVRTKYCSSALESTDQLKHLAEFLDKPELVTRYKSAVYDDFWGTAGRGYASGWSASDWYDSGLSTQHSFPSQHSARESAVIFESAHNPRCSNKCSQCLYMEYGKCELFNIPRRWYDQSCEDFLDSSLYE